MFGISRYHRDRESCIANRIVSWVTLIHCVQPIRSCKSRRGGEKAWPPHPGRHPITWICSLGRLCFQKHDLASGHHSNKRSKAVTSVDETQIYKHFKCHCCGWKSPVCFIPKTPEFQLESAVLLTYWTLMQLFQLKFKGLNIGSVVLVLRTTACLHACVAFFSSKRQIKVLALLFCVACVRSSLLKRCVYDPRHSHEEN